MNEVRTGPKDYTEGLGEVIRGYRLYTGLTREAMAARIGMALRSYERIEDGCRGTACPPGLFDTLETILAEFDDAVGKMSVAGRTAPIKVSTDPALEWRRCVADRAAVEYEHITPMLTRARRQDKHAARQGS